MDKNTEASLFRNYRKSHVGAKEVRYWFRPDPAPKLSANLYDIHYCCVYNEKLLMMDRGTVRNV